MGVPTPAPTPCSGPALYADTVHDAGVVGYSYWRISNGGASRGGYWALSELRFKSNGVHLTSFARSASDRGSPGSEHMQAVDNDTSTAWRPGTDIVGGPNWDDSKIGSVWMIVQLQGPQVVDTIEVEQASGGYVESLRIQAWEGPGINLAQAEWSCPLDVAVTASSEVVIPSLPVFTDGALQSKAMSVCALALGFLIAQQGS